MNTLASNHTVIYSHGFGVSKDDRGLFTDIAAALPGLEHITGHNFEGEGRKQLIDSIEQELGDG